MRHIFAKKHGFTLVELMIAFSIFSILILILYSTFFSQYKRLNNQLASGENISDGARVIKAVTEVVDDYGNITVVNGQVLSFGTIIIDADSGETQEGSRLNLNPTTGQLTDENGNKIAENISSLQLIMGPTTYDDVEIVEGVLLIEAIMESRDTTYSVKGGINVEK